MLITGIAIGVGCLISIPFIIAQLKLSYKEYLLACKSQIRPRFKLYHDGCKADFQEINLTLERVLKMSVVCPKRWFFVHPLGYQEYKDYEVFSFNNKSKVVSHYDTYIAYISADNKAYKIIFSYKEYLKYMNFINRWNKATTNHAKNDADISNNKSLNDFLKSVQMDIDELDQIAQEEMKSVSDETKRQAQSLAKRKNLDYFTAFKIQIRRDYPKWSEEKINTELIKEMRNRSAWQKKKHPNHGTTD